MTHDLNAISAWTGMFLGVVSGIAMGLFFHRDDWLGGYDSWPRRMLRLGHLAFFGFAFVNLAYALTLKYLGWPEPHPLTAGALAASTLLTPAVCFLAAWHKPLRHFFALPTVCTLVGVADLLWARLATIL